MHDVSEAGLSPWEAELLALADADDADPAADAFRPAQGVDAGEWQGLGLEEWTARFCGRRDDEAGRMPIVVGPARRRVDRVIRRRAVA